MIGFRACCTMLGVGLLCTSTTHANLIVNGGFEGSFGVHTPPFFSSPGFPVIEGGWIFNGGGGVFATSGNPGRAGRLEWDGDATSDPTISQTVSGLTIGQTYLLSFDLALNVNVGGSSANGPSFGVFRDTQTLGSALFLGQQLNVIYLTQYVNFMATSTSHTLIFAGELDGRTNGAGTTDVSYRLDNVSMVAVATSVPEPTSMALLSLAGIGGLAVRMRRRRNTSILNRLP